MFKLNKIVSAGVFATALVATSPGLAAIEKSDILPVVNNVAGIENEAINNLYRKSIIEHKNVSKTVGLLSKFATNKANNKAQRANAELVIAHMYWRYGNPDDALKAVDRSLAINSSENAFLLKARLLDTKGKPQQSVSWYKKAMDATKSDAEREFISIRLTMIDSSENASALVAMAESRDQAFKNRAAVVLALLGYQEDAINLYKIEADADKPFQQYIRLADWAIKAGDFDLAKTHAWNAIDQAGAAYDLRYGLSVLIEAYRKADKLEQVLDVLASKPDILDLQQARVDVLIELEKYNDAITLFKSNAGEEMDIEQQQRLLQLYLSAGREADMVAEYDRLIKEQPEEVLWYDGLASYYMDIGDPEKSLGVWTNLENNNPESVHALVTGAESMINMGFFDEAVAMVGRIKGDISEIIPAYFFLFDAHYKAGDNASAVTTLEKLEELLPEFAGEHKDIADAYERLNRHDKALAIYQKLDTNGNGLGYDERTRLAWLYSLNDNKDEALKIWQDIWVKVKSPARRAFAEEQLMLISAELNMLADMVVELEEKIALGEATNDEANLLIRIYINSGDAFSATEVIEEYARAANLSEVALHTQLGQIYQMMGDYDAYDGTLRKLLAIEPDFSEEHIRNIILNLLSNNLRDQKEDRLAEVTRLLNQLKETNGEAVSGEFEAGVMSMGGFNDLAIDSYRTAIAQYPTHSDNLLLLSDLMKGEGRRDEAVAILQYIAEHADGDNEFVVAIDGIINMIGARRFGEDLTDEIKSTFNWVHRIILERITARKDKFYLYTLLSDVAEETKDHEAQFKAIENSLAQAGIRRSSILRELITLSTEGFNPGGGGVRLGDSQRKLDYGRRLIGLKQDLPPEIYIDLGTSLLDIGDASGAEKSFDLISDITGMIDVDKTKAEIFHKAGYIDKALAYYNKALSRNQNDLSLLNKTGLLREQNNQDDIANNWYWQALSNLLKRQPAFLRNGPPKLDPQMVAFGQAVDTSVTRGFRTHYESLINGFIITWPSDSKVASKRKEQLWSLLEEELQRIKTENTDNKSKPLSHFSRLNQMAQSIRRVAQATGDRNFAAKADLAISEQFSHDAEYAQDMQKYYYQWGDSKTAKNVARSNEINDLRFSSGKPLPLLKQHQIVDADSSNINAAIKMTTMNSDVQHLESLILDLINKGKIMEGFGRGLASLTEDQFRKIVGSRLSTIRANHEDKLYGLLVSDYELVEKIETVLGLQLVSNELVKKNLITPPRSSRPAFFGFGKSPWDYAIKNMTVNDMLDIAEVNAPKVTEYGSGPFYEYYDELLKLSLSAEQQQRMIDIVGKGIQAQDTKNEFAAPRLLQNLLVLNAPDANKHIVVAGAKAIQDKLRIKSDLGALITSYYAGDKLSAFETLISVSKEGRIPSYVLSQMSANFSDVIENIGSDFLEGKPVSDELVEVYYRSSFERYSWYTPTVEILNEKNDFLKRLVSRFPDKVNYQYDQALVNHQLGNLVAFESDLTKLYESNKKEPFVRAALFEFYKQEHRYSDAAKLNADGGPDMTSPETAAMMQQQIARSGRGGRTGAAGIYQALVPQSSNRNFGMGDSKNRALALLTVIQSLESGEHENSRRLFRGFWRDKIRMKPGYDRSGRISVNQLLNVPYSQEMSDLSGWFGGFQRENDISLQEVLTNGDETKKRLLIDELAKTDFFADELDTYLSAFNKENRIHNIRLYGILDSAYHNDQQRQSRRKSLEKSLTNGAITDHELTLLVTLISDESSVSKRVLNALEQKALIYPEMSTYQQRHIARILANGKAYESAGDMYRVLAANIFQFNEFSGNNFFGGENTGELITAIDLFKEISEKFPEQMAAEIGLDLIRAARRADNNLHGNDLFQALVIKASEFFVTADKREDYISSVEGINALTLTPEQKVRSNIIVEQVKLSAQQSNWSKATEYLLAGLQPDAVEENSDPEQGYSPAAQKVRYVVAGMTAKYGLKNTHHTSTTWKGLMVLVDELFYLSDKTIANNWLNHLSGQFTSFRNNKSLDQGRVTELFFLMAHKMSAIGMKDKATAVLAQVGQDMLSSPSIYTLRNWGDLALTADLNGLELPLAASDYIATQNLLTAEQKASMIGRLVSQDNSTEAYQTAKNLAGDSNSLNVLTALAEVAGKANAGQDVKQLQGRISQLEQDKQQLKL